MDFANQVYATEVQNYAQLTNSTVNATQISLPSQVEGLKNVVSNVFSFSVENPQCSISFELFGRQMSLSFCEYEQYLRSFANVLKIVSIITSVVIMFV